MPLVPDTPRAITVDAENVMAPLTAAVARSATGIMRVEPLRWVIGDPASGGMAVADVSRRRESGAQWSTSASAWLARPAAEGWEPALVLRLQATRGDLAPYFIGTHVVVP